MMDCSKTEVFFNEFKRMCKSYHTDKQAKEECKIHHIVENCGECMGFVKSETSFAIKFVQEWSDAHQPKTRLSELLEKYPKTKLYGASELPRFCVADLYGTTCEDMGMVGVGCAECWNTPIDEQGVQP